MRPISRSELAALVDLGLSDEVLARYLETDTARLAELRARYHIGQSATSRTWAFDASITDMREQARLLIEEARTDENPARRAEAAEQAFALAQFAESNERRRPDAAATQENGVSGRGQQESSEPVAVLLDKAKQWRMRAAEYWAVSEAMRTPLARHTYAHLAQSYERMADQFETRAQHLTQGAQVSRKDETG